MPQRDRILSCSVALGIVGALASQSCRATPVLTAPQQIDVLASRGRQASGARVEAGRPITIVYVSGSIHDAETSIADANGSDYVCGASTCCEPAPHSRRSALLARVAGEVITIGNGATFLPRRDGELELRINDCDEGLYDNGGALKIRVAPG